MVQEITYESSERSDTELGEERVHVRQEDRGVMHYAVFDGENRVSDTVGPLNEEYILNFLEGYERARDEYILTIDL